MLEFLKDKRYRNSSELANYQDHILNMAGINLNQIDGYLRELEKYNILFQSFLGYNAIPENNLAIRNNLIKSVLFYLKKDFQNAKKCKMDADEIFIKLKIGWFYIEGFSYFLYVKKAYDFYFKFIPQYEFGNIDMSTLTTMTEFYRKITCLDGTAPTTDTSNTDILQPDPARINYHNDYYSVHILNNQSTYIFIDHNTRINEFSKNLHVNYTFGHFTVFHKGEHLVIGPGYPGYSLKQSSQIKESWNNNIIYGSHCNEPLWRYKPYKPKLEWTYDNKNVYNLKIGNDITRKIEILDNGIFFSDSGGEYSSFNISKDCDPNASGTKIEQSIGYHSPDYGSVVPHKRLKLFGNHRLFYMGF